MTQELSQNTQDQAVQRVKLKRHGRRPISFEGSLLLEAGDLSQHGIRARIWESQKGFFYQVILQSSPEGASETKVEFCEDVQTLHRKLNGEFGIASVLNLTNSALQLSGLEAIHACEKLQSKIQSNLEQQKSVVASLLQGAA